MARHNLLHLHDRIGTVTRASIDDLLRPSLRWAFPLPPEDHADDERFRLVLDALTQRGSRSIGVKAVALRGS